MKWHKALILGLCLVSGGINLPPANSAQLEELDLQGQNLLFGWLTDQYFGFKLQPCPLRSTAGSQFCTKVQSTLKQSVPQFDSLTRLNKISLDWLHLQQLAVTGDIKAEDVLAFEVESLSLPRARYEALLLKAYYYAQAHNLPQSNADLQAAEKIALASHEKEMLIRIYWLKARMAAFWYHDKSLAQSSLKKALELSKGDSQLMARTLMYQAQMLAILSEDDGGNLAELENSLKPALASVKNNCSGRLRGETALVLSEVQAQQSNYADALQNLKMAQEKCSGLPFEELGWADYYQSLWQSANGDPVETNRLWQSVKNFEAGRDPELALLPLEELLKLLQPEQPRIENGSPSEPMVSRALTSYPVLPIAFNRFLSHPETYLRALFLRYCALQGWNVASAAQTALTSTAPEVRASAVFALARQTSANKLPMLVEALKDSSPTVRREALHVLSRQPELLQKLKPNIKALSGDSDSSVRLTVLATLISIASLEDAPLFEAMISDKVLEVRIQAISGLSEIRGYQLPEKYQAIVAELVQDVKILPDFRLDALTLLSSRPDIKIIPIILRAQKSMPQTDISWSLSPFFRAHAAQTTAELQGLAKQPELQSEANMLLDRYHYFIGKYQKTGFIVQPVQPLVKISIPGNVSLAVSDAISPVNHDGAFDSAQLNVNVKPETPWQLRIEDAFGETKWQQRGTGPKMLIWNGEGEEEPILPEGEYLAILASEQGESYSRIIIDNTSPQSTKLGSMTKPSLFIEIEMTFDPSVNGFAVGLGSLTENEFIVDEQINSKVIVMTYALAGKRRQILEVVLAVLWPMLPN